MSGVARSELADQHKPSAGGLEVLPGAVQLDRVRLAIDSAVVTQPDQGDGSVSPEISQADVIAILVGENDVPEGIGCGGLGHHGRSYWPA